MATLDDLPISDLSTLSDDDLLNLIRETRGRRRNPDPEVKRETVRKATSKRKQGKAAALQKVSTMLEGLSKEQAAELLKQLTSNQSTPSNQPL